MTFCSIPLAKWHPRPPQHILHSLCQATTSYTFSSAATLLTHLGVGENRPGSEELTHPIMFVHQCASIGFTMQETLHCALRYHFLLSCEEI